MILRSDGQIRTLCLVCEDWTAVGQPCKCGAQDAKSLEGEALIEAHMRTIHRQLAEAN